jgi:hypothetical protein
LILIIFMYLSTTPRRQPSPVISLGGGSLVKEHKFSISRLVCV